MKRVWPVKEAVDQGVVSAIELDSADYKNLKTIEENVIKFAEEAMAIIDRDGKRQILVSVRGEQKFFPVNNFADKLLNFSINQF